MASIFPSKYAGSCRACHEAIAIGELVEWDPEAHRGVVCMACSPLLYEAVKIAVTQGADHIAITSAQSPLLSLNLLSPKDLLGVNGHGGEREAWARIVNVLHPDRATGLPPWVARLFCELTAKVNGAYEKASGHG